MKIPKEKMEYPLKERIGSPNLLVGRKKEFAKFHKWIDGIPREASKSWAILARKKSGKTAFVQRLFNQVWSANGEVIPFYLEVPDHKVWFPDFAVLYYRTFASQYISFLERDPSLVRDLLSLEEISEYGKEKGIRSFVRDIKELEKNFSQGHHDLMWLTAYTAPHRFAGVYDKRVLVILDEFQHLSEYICIDKERKNPHESLPGSYHEVSESKIAPMLATGSSVGWLVNVLHKYLEAGRLTKTEISPYLTWKEGLRAVYRYAKHYQERITNETALLINQLTYSDPHFIACVMRSQYEKKKLNTKRGVRATVRFESSDTRAELAGEWRDYFDKSLDRINQDNAKKILLFLTKNPRKGWNPEQLKKELQLDITPKQIHNELEMLRMADFIYGIKDGFFTYFGHADGTFYLVMRQLFKYNFDYFGVELENGLSYREEELKKKNKSLQSALNSDKGHIAELQLSVDMLNRKTFPLSHYFTWKEGEENEELNEMLEVESVDTRYPISIPSGSYNRLLEAVDLRTDFTDGKVLLVEVKKWEEKVGRNEIDIFWKKVELFRQQPPEREVLAGFLSLGGFSEKALEACSKHNIGVATEIHYIQTEWSK